MKGLTHEFDLKSNQPDSHDKKPPTTKTMCVFKGSVMASCTPLYMYSFYMHKRHTPMQTHTQTDTQ